MKGLIWLIILGAIGYFAWDNRDALLEQVGDMTADTTGFSQGQVDRVKAINDTLPQTLSAPRNLPGCGPNVVCYRGGATFTKARMSSGEVLFNYTIDLAAKNLYPAERASALTDIRPVMVRIFCSSEKKFRIDGVSPVLVISGSDGQSLGRIETTIPDCRRG